jgi:hypothetical protein
MNCPICDIALVTTGMFLETNPPTYQCQCKQCYFVAALQGKEWSTFIDGEKVILVSNGDVGEMD